DGRWLVMGVGVRGGVVVAMTGRWWLTGCETTSVKPPEFLNWNGEKQKDTADDTTGSVGASHGNWFGIGDKGPPAQPDPPLMPSTPNDDLRLGRMNFKHGNYGLPRRAVESGAREADAWLGLAASYDRLRRYDLADRAYKQLYGLVGRTPEILNNQGYSMMLRGDYAHARTILGEARAKDPNNPYITN